MLSAKFGYGQRERFKVLLVSHLHFSYSLIANEAGAEPSENSQVVELTLIPTPVSQNLGGRTVVLSLWSGTSAASLRLCHLMAAPAQHTGIFLEALVDGEMFVVLIESAES